MAGPSRFTKTGADLGVLDDDSDDGDLALTPQEYLLPQSTRSGGRLSPVIVTDNTKSQSPRLSPSSPGDECHEGRDSMDENSKEAADWYQESHGKRVGYDDLTAIDWIFEYSKDRQRVRKLLAGSHGLSGALKQLADASNVWIVLVLTGVATGLVAAGINIASDWLGDIKIGYCKNGDDGGRFYLSRQFCCWGHDDLAQCQDWTPWRTALRIPSLGGGYIVEYIFFVIFSVLFAILAAILVKEYSPYAKQSGIPEIKTVLGGFVIRRFMGAWTLVTKSIGLCLAVSSGLWVGKEGPLVHVACCCANLIMKPFASLSQNEARKREILSAAAASGISVAFGAPIGGVLFSLEQLSYYFPDKTMWQSFVCAMVAAVTLQALNPFHTGKIVLYQVTYSTGWHSFEMVPFVLLGVLGGIFGGLFTHLNMLVARFRKSDHNPLKKKPLFEVLVISILTAIINFPNIFMRAQLSELVYYLFAECATIGNRDIFGLCRVTTAGSLSMATLLVTASGLGFVMASITFGLPIPAGIILPSIAIGALHGRAVGVVMQLSHKHFTTSMIFAACEPDVPCITPGTYAIVGAAASLAGVTRLTASIVVIMFELTGALTYVLPIMIAVMLSKWVADAISKRGIYEAWIHFNEYPYLDNKDAAQIPHVPVSNIMTAFADITCIDATRVYTIGELKALLQTSNFKGYPIVEPAQSWSVHTSSAAHGLSPDQNTLVGYLSRIELTYALDQALRPGSGPHGTSYTIATRCYFRYSVEAASGIALDLRPWTDQTPITLNANSSFQMAVNMFQSMGLRYLLLVERGSIRGILTKKDVWWILNASEEAHKGDRFVPGAGVLREETDDGNATAVEAEGRGLLHEDDGTGDGRGG